MCVISLVPWRNQVGGGACGGGHDGAEPALAGIDERHAPHSLSRKPGLHSNTVVAVIASGCGLIRDVPQDAGRRQRHQGSPVGEFGRAAAPCSPCSMRFNREGEGVSA